MVEWIRLARKRDLIADILHAVFNLAFVIIVTLAAIFFQDTLWPGIILILLSKWRTIAVRPRYWWTNFLGSLTDLFFGLAIVVLMWQAGVAGLANNVEAWPIQICLGVIYAVWMIWIKPMHKHVWVTIQSGLSQFFALTALFSIAHILPAGVVVLLSFTVAFASARQFLGLYEEKSKTLLAMIWGLMIAMLAFAAWHWTVAYQIMSLLKVPQIAIIATVFGVVAERAYSGWHDDQKIQWNEIGWPLIFAIITTIVLVFGFGGL